MTLNKLFEEIRLKTSPKDPILKDLDTKRLTQLFNKKLNNFFTKDFLKKVYRYMPNKIKLQGINLEMEKDEDRTLGFVYKIDSYSDYKLKTYLKKDSDEFVLSKKSYDKEFSKKDPKNQKLRANISNRIFLTKTTLSKKEDQIIDIIFHEFFHLMETNARSSYFRDVEKMKTELIRTFSEARSMNYKEARDKLSEMLPKFTSGRLIMIMWDLIPGKKIHEFSRLEINKIRNVIKKYNIFDPRAINLIFKYAKRGRKVYQNVDKEMEKEENKNK